MSEIIKINNSPTNYTIVTAFFNIRRDQWNNGFARKIDGYLDMAKRVMTLDDYMFIIVEEDMVEWIKTHRGDKMSKTHLVTMKLSDLPYWSKKEQMEKIASSEQFKKDLYVPERPEVSIPTYSIIMWSKVPLVRKAIRANTFGTSHFVWLDFGIHNHILPDERLGKHLFENPISDKIKIMARSMPDEKTDSNMNWFYKAGINRFAGGLFGGSSRNFVIFVELFDKVVEECLKNNLIECDQTLFVTAYLKNKELFDVYQGDWYDIIRKF